MFTSRNNAVDEKYGIQVCYLLFNEIITKNKNAL